jgi:hypothetical protein
VKTLPSRKQQPTGLENPLPSVLGSRDFGKSLLNCLVHSSMNEFYLQTFAKSPRNAEMILTMKISCYAYRSPHTSSLTVISRVAHSRNIEERLQLLNEQPFVVGNICSVELLQRVDTCSANKRVERIGLLEMSSICRLMATHFDFHSYRRLSLLTDLNLFMVTLNTSPVSQLLVALVKHSGINLHSSDADDLLHVSDWILLHCGDRRVHLKVSFNNIHTNDNRSCLVEYGDRLQNTWEDSQ